MASKDLKECSTTLSIEEMYVKTIMRFHLSPVSMAVVKKGNKCQCRYGERGWDCKLVQPYRNRYGSSSKSGSRPTDDPALLLQESMSKLAYHGHTCTSMQYPQWHDFSPLFLATTFEEVSFVQEFIVLWPFICYSISLSFDVLISKNSIYYRGLM